MLYAGFSFNLCCMKFLTRLIQLENHVKEYPVLLKNILHRDAFSIQFKNQAMMSIHDYEEFKFFIEFLQKNLSDLSCYISQYEAQVFRYGPGMKYTNRLYRAICNLFFKMNRILYNALQRECSSLYNSIDWFSRCCNLKSQESLNDKYTLLLSYCPNLEGNSSTRLTFTKSLSYLKLVSSEFVKHKTTCETIYSNLNLSLSLADIAPSTLQYFETLKDIACEQLSNIRNLQSYYNLLSYNQKLTFRSKLTFASKFISRRIYGITFKKNQVTNQYTSRFNPKNFLELRNRYSSVKSLLKPK